MIAGFDTNKLNRQYIPWSLSQPNGEPQQIRIVLSACCWLISLQVWNPQDPCVIAGFDIENTPSVHSYRAPVNVIA